MVAGPGRAQSPIHYDHQGKIVRARIQTVASVLVSAIVVASAPDAQAQTPSNEQLYERIQQQQREIEALRRDRQTPDTDADVGSDRGAIEARVNAQQQQIEALADRQQSNRSPASRTVIAGYGELHYNNFDNGDDEIDFHRFVLEIGHQFNDKWRFYSELELEHAFVETTEVEVEGRNAANGITGLEVERQPGELELEQAWVERDLGQRHALRLGLDLIPVGIINTTHEPTTFYGVERNQVETRIIPSTWREGGIELIGRPSASGVSYRLFAHSGFGLEAEDDFTIRGGRQNLAEAVSNEFATTGQIKYTGVPGVELASSVQYQDDVSQQRNDGLDSAWLYEAHADIQRGPFGLRTLYAQWDFNGAIAEDNGRDKQFGWYIEPSFRAFKQLGLFARYAELEEIDSLTEENTTLGLNFWPIRNVVLKADYQFRDIALAGGDRVDADSFNLGLGYVFP